MATNGEGLFDRTKNATDKYQQADLYDVNMIANLMNDIDTYMNGLESGEDEPDDVVDKNFVRIFGYTGAYQEFVAPYSGTFKIELWGASGGKTANQNVNVGKGGYSTGKIKLKKDDKLYVFVGGEGMSNTAVATVSPGGFNGGGNSSSQSNYVTSSGGGATDVRTQIDSTGKWDDSDSLLSRIIVAGGGGSGVYYATTAGSTAGDGGGNVGVRGSCDYSGYGGTQTAGGTFVKAYSGSTAQVGSFGKGGNGGQYLGGSGGGGWYGGAAGTAYGGNGGGGSGFIYTENTVSLPSGYIPSSKYYLTDAESIAGNLEVPTYDGTSTMIGNIGNGYAKISYTDENVVNSREYTGLFAYTGTYQEFIAPRSGIYKLELWGASGGKTVNKDVNVGKGGYSTGEIKLEKNDKLYVFVGGEGTSNRIVNLVSPGGFNGGGNSSSQSNYVTASGGGATDVRTQIDSTGKWDDSDSLLSRIIVAGGGGSAVYYSSTVGSTAGAGGGDTGVRGSCDYSGYGGTQTAGGTFVKAYSGSTAQAGSFGKGGNGGQYLGGSGGGGWYGGAAGTANGGNGGGGSGFIYTENSTSLPGGYIPTSKYYLRNAETLSGEQTIPTYDGTSTMNGNIGNGYVKITFVAEN